MEYKYGYIVLHANGRVTIRPLYDYHIRLDDLYESIDCKCIEIVRTRFQHKGHDVLMVVDDIGKLVRKPINLVGTYLYCNPHDCIVGDVVIGTSYSPNPNEEPDIFAFSLADAEEMLKALK